MWYKTEEGWMNTSSEIPRALYGTPRDDAYLLPFVMDLSTMSFRMAT